MVYTAGLFQDITSGVNVDRTQARFNKKTGREPREADDSGGVQLRGASQILPGDEDYTRLFLIFIFYILFKGIFALNSGPDSMMLGMIEHT